MIPRKKNCHEDLVLLLLERERERERLGEEKKKLLSSSKFVMLSSPPPPTQTGLSFPIPAEQDIYLKRCFKPLSKRSLP